MFSFLERFNEEAAEAIITQSIAEVKVALSPISSSTLLSQETQARVHQANLDIVNAFLPRRGDSYNPRYQARPRDLPWVIQARGWK